MADFSDRKFCTSILDLAQAYGPYEFWTANLLSGCNPDATWRALMVVAALKDPLYAESARSMLASSDSRVRAWACVALAELKYRPAFAQIHALTQDSSSRVRYRAWRSVRALEGLPLNTRRFHVRGPAGKVLILISEDDINFQSFLNFALSRKGYQVQIAATEQDSVQMAIQLCPKLVITDNQKDQDGLSGLNMTWDLCRRKELRDTLFFMITADKVESIFLWSGGDEYFEKPIDIVTLESVIRQYFSQI